MATQTASAKHLDRVLEKVGGATALAAACGLTDGAVRYWVKHGRVTSAPAARFLEYYMQDEHGYTVKWQALHGK